MSAPIVLVDGSSYLFRAYHGLPPLTNSKGNPTGAVKGVCNMIRSLMQNYPQSTVVVIFDAKGPTFRNDIYPDYKANRPPMPDDLRIQIQPIHDIIRAMGLPLISIEGVEADDVIGTYALQATQQGLDVIISTGDKDMAQLVSPHVSLINTMKNELLNEQGVRDKYGFGAEHMIDYLALMGDKVDNIPGIPGVGEKTALGLIQGLGGLTDIYANLDKVKELSFRGAKTMDKKLIEHKASAELSYTLATIKCDVELAQTLTELAMQPADEAELLRLYQEQEFKGWINTLTEQGVTAATNDNPNEASNKPTASAAATMHAIEFPEDVNYSLLSNIAEVEALMAQCYQTGNAALLPLFDNEHYLAQQLIGLSIAPQFGTASFIDFRQQATSWTQVKPHLAALVKSYHVKKIGVELKRWLHWLSRETMPSSHHQNDVQLMAFVLDSTLKRDKDLDKAFSPYGLENLSRHFLQQNITGFDDIAGKFGAKQLKLADLNSEQLAPYANQQADYLLRLCATLEQQLQQNDDLWRVYHDIERPLIRVLAKVEENGTYIDDLFLSQLADHLSQRIEALKQQSWVIAGSEFSLDSPKQVGKVLFEDLGLPALKKTATGAASTNEEVLSELALSYELPALILQYRHLRKLLGTYAEPLPKLINGQTGRVHTTYNQMGAATGRFSSTDPNLQNIPIRSPEGREIRKAFVAKPGYKIVAADYSQIELRIMTHLSQDQTLINAFREGKDIHRATAAEIMGLPEEDVSSEQRRSAKAINFGLIYGMSAFGLAKQLNISRSDAKLYVDKYFERYPGVLRFMDETRVDASEKGYVSTIYGRRLNLPDIQSSNAMVRKGAERTAINAPMQGTAADIIKRAMVDVQNWLDSSHLDAVMIMQVHDELVFEVAEADVPCLIEGVKFRMSHAASIDVPLVVDVGVGDNWDEAH